jgi:hypothetical protein
MKNLGKLTSEEIVEYEKAARLYLDDNRQKAYIKIWDKIKKRLKIPPGHSLIINSFDDWTIFDKGEHKNKHKK